MAKVVSRRESRAKIENEIIAIMWYFGFTRRQALNYMAETSQSTIAVIVATYNKTAKLAFYND